MKKIADSIFKGLREAIESKTVVCQCDCCFKDISESEIMEDLAYRVHGKVICRECYENMVERGRRHDF